MINKSLLNKGFIVPVLIGVIAVLIVGGGVYLYSNKKVEAPIAVSDKLPEEVKKEVVKVGEEIKVETPASSGLSVKQDTSNKSFKLGTLEFSYPSVLTLKNTGDVVSLGHSIPFKHINACDLKDGLSINELSDFGASFELFDKNLKDTIVSNESDYFSKNYIKNDTFDLSDGFVIKYNIGNLSGFKISMGLEGCGVDNYYFILSPTKTLAVSKDWHAGSYQVQPSEFNKLPGVITKDKNEQIFKDILSSVKGVITQETMSVKVFYPNSLIDKGFLDCNVVRPTIRTIPYTLATGEASLKELIKGPTTEEIKAGFQTQIDSNTIVKSISVKDGTASVFFSKDLQKKNVGLCAGQFINAQIKETLLQFPTIKKVNFSVEGLIGDFVQP